MPCRKNQKNLTVAERTAYVNAVKALKAAPSKLNPPTAGRYDDFVFVHMLAMMRVSIPNPGQQVNNTNLNMLGNRAPGWAHRLPAFFPWHRELLHQLEKELQAVSGNPNLTIPYWDWSVDQNPNAAPWTADFMGGDGNDGPVGTGPFTFANGWHITLSEDGQDRLIRGFGRAPGFANLPTPNDVTQALSTTPYDQNPWNDSSTLHSFRNQ